MTILLAAALATSIPGAKTAAPTQVRIVRSIGRAPRYVRMRSRIAGAGLHGTATSLLDLSDGRYVEHAAAGPLSWSDGFDGRRSWSADATGMATVEGNADTLRDASAWAYLYGRSARPLPSVRVLAERPLRRVLRLTFPGLSGPIDVTVDRGSGTVVAVEDHSGAELTRSHFTRYRRFGAVVVPVISTDATRYGVWREHVDAVDFPATVREGAFTAPQPPDDATLHGVTTLWLDAKRRLPIVTVRIDNGPPMRMLFDSGGSNSLNPASARRLGLHLVGEDKSGGVGPGMTRQRYTTVARLRIGDAVLRNQPFAVLYDDSSPDIDGTIGCEVLQRFTVRFDFRKKRVDLAPDAAALAGKGPAIPIRFAGCQPEIDGGFDAFAGPLAIDTGSAFGLDVMAPFTRANRLVERYHATESISGIGIGGETVGYRAEAKTLRMGSVIATNVPVKLNLTRAGAFGDPTQLGNVGIAVLSRYVVTFDYRTSRMWLSPP